MNDTQLENAIRAELAADATRTPAAEPTKLAVRAAVAGLPSPDRAQLARRWLLPIAAAAVLVALLVAGFLVPKALSSHPARPAAPKTTPPPAPVVKFICPIGQQTVSGLSAAFIDKNQALRFAYEYYCAGPGRDGERGASDVQIFQEINGNLVQDRNEHVPLLDSYLMSMTGFHGGLKLQEYSLSRTADGPYGAVQDLIDPIDALGSPAAVTTIARPCLSSDLKVSVSQAHEPVPHTVLTLTNTSATACSVWGTPTYRIVGSVPATIRYLVNGPAGGAENLPSSPPLLVQPGQVVSASVGSDPIHGQSCQQVEAVDATLPNGVSLGRPDLGVCDNVVGYPFVDSSNGSLTHPESEAPHNTAAGTCVDNVATVIELGTPTAAVNHRRHDVITIHPADKGNCTLSGFADVRQLSPSGALQAIAQQTASGPVGGISGSTPSTVDVSPGHPASVLIEWSDQGQSCTTSGQISLRLGGGAYTSSDPTGTVCDLQVHPFVAGPTGGVTGQAVATCGVRSSTLTAPKIADGSHAGFRYVWKNNGAEPCQISGYPQAVFKDQNGQVVQTIAQAPSGELGGLTSGQQPPTIILMPNDSLSAVVEWTTGSAGAGCVHASRVVVTVPGGGADFGLDGQAVECDAQVHPFVFGTTGRG